MGNISFNFELNKRPNKRGKYAVVLRITEDRQHKRSNTGVEISRTADWNSTRQEVKTTAEYSDQLNKQLQEIMENAKAAYRELKSEGTATSSSVMRKAVSDSQKKGLLDFCHERIHELDNSRQFGTAKKYGDTVNKLESFLQTRKQNDLLLCEIDMTFINKFQEFLVSIPNNRDPEKKNSLAPNTVVKHQKVLRAILTTAVERGYISDNPMENVSLKEISVPQRHLTREELQKLQKAPFKPGTGLCNARDLYLFAIYCAGMRIGDVLSLRWNNITEIDGKMRIQYVIMKTKKTKEFTLVEEAQQILSKYKPDSTPSSYIFPYLDNTADYARYKSFNDIQTMPKAIHKDLFNAINSREALVNKQLKQVADMLSLEPFSFHSSRRDFAALANSSGVNCLQVQDMLGHESLATTERYMRTVDTSRIDNALEQVFSNETKERRAKVLVRELIGLGYGKNDVKRLFDEVRGGTKKNETSTKHF